MHVRELGGAPGSSVTPGFGSKGDPPGCRTACLLNPTEVKKKLIQLNHRWLIVRDGFLLAQGDPSRMLLVILQTASTPMCSMADARSPLSPEPSEPDCSSDGQRWRSHTQLGSWSSPGGETCSSTCCPGSPARTAPIPSCQGAMHLLEDGPYRESKENIPCPRPRLHGDRGYYAK
jgi:hypothetical protein